LAGTAGCRVPAEVGPKKSKPTTCASFRFFSQWHAALRFRVKLRRRVKSCATRMLGER
jgi:hypothetical protein